MPAGGQATVEVGVPGRPFVVFEGDDEETYGDALVYLARAAQRATGIGARDLTLLALERERHRGRRRPLRNRQAA